MFRTWSCTVVEGAGAFTHESRILIIRLIPGLAAAGCGVLAGRPLGRWQIHSEAPPWQAEAQGP